MQFDTKTSKLVYFNFHLISAFCISRGRCSDDISVHFPMSLNIMVEFFHGGQLVGCYESYDIHW